MYLYHPSPRSVEDTTTPGNTSTYTAAQYVARPAGVYAGKGNSQYNMIQGPSYGSTAPPSPTNPWSLQNYGSDYFQDAYGYQTGYAPTMAPSEPVTYGAGAWVNGKYVAQPLPSTNWPTRQVPQIGALGWPSLYTASAPPSAWDEAIWDESKWG